MGVFRQGIMMEGGKSVLCRILTIFKFPPRIFIFSLFQKFTAPFKISKIHGPIESCAIPAGMNFAGGGGLSGLRCILRKKNGSTTRTRLNHKAHTAQSARLNHTDGSINCLLLLLHIHSCSHWLSSSKRNHGQQSVMNRESSLSILMTM